MKTTQKQQAKDLFFGTNLSRKEIAEELAVDEKTLYLWIKKEAWDEHKKAAHAAPAIIVDNLCYMLVELQNYIAERPIGLRFPTAKEADSMRKLINSIYKMKQYSSVGMNMQMMVDFTNYIGADQQFCDQLQAYAESYFTARKANPRYNNDFGFESEQSPAAAEAELKEIRDNIYADITMNSRPNDYTDRDIDHTQRATGTEQIPDSNSADQSGIPQEGSLETLINKAFEPPTGTSAFCPEQGKIGNSSCTIKRPTFLNRSKKTIHYDTIAKPHPLYPPIAA